MMEFVVERVDFQRKHVHVRYGDLVLQAKIVEGDELAQPHVMKPPFTYIDGSDKFFQFISIVRRAWLGQDDGDVKDGSSRKS